MAVFPAQFGGDDRHGGSWLSHGTRFPRPQPAERHYRPILDSCLAKLTDERPAGSGDVLLRILSAPESTTGTELRALGVVPAQLRTRTLIAKANGAGDDESLQDAPRATAQPPTFTELAQAI